ncbi:MAG TPA: M23 family metallopeptidase [Thermoanaerobaculia bacterium]|nr:M23 family metallopeptidase [Thermoanaerobaculia bacterium]
MKLALVLFAVSLTTLPPVPLVETTKNGQAVNFDLLLENGGDAKLTITQIEATLLGPHDALVTQRRLAENGDSIATLPQRTIEPHAKLVVFNPFASFESEYALQKIRYEVTFDNGEKSTVVVAPRAYETKTNLILPLKGRVFVHDGHDFYSHHRRLDVTGPMTTALGITENMTRYAYDFTVIDEQGRMHRDDGETNDEWFGFGTDIVAPGDGVVVKSASDRADGTKSQRAPLDGEAVMKDITLIFGNYAIIDHGNGEFSLLGHMRNGSVTVKPGDRVKQGQKIGEMGCSGDSMFPHLHYQLQRDAHLGEGLPSSFRDYKRFTGAAWLRVTRGAIDTGDVVQSAR